MMPGSTHMWLASVSTTGRPSGHPCAMGTHRIFQRTQGLKLHSGSGVMLTGRDGPLPDGDRWSPAGDGFQRKRWGSTSIATLTVDGGGREASQHRTARWTLRERSA